MRRVALTPVMLSTLLVAACNPVFAQTSKDINSLLKNSKLVDTGRQVNSTVGKNCVSISTFSHRHATDEDCKITALLMMKELRQHYKSITKATVLFFDPANVESYRKVEIREGDVVLVDMGKSPKEILSQISISTGTRRVQRRQGSGLVSSTHSGSARTRTRSSRSAQYSIPGYKTYISPDKSVSMLYPADWAPSASEAGMALMKVVSTSGRCTVSIALYKQRMSLIPNLYELAEKQIELLKARYGVVKVRAKRERTINGVPGTYFEASASALGIVAVDRTMILRDGQNVFRVTMYSFNGDDHELDQIFEKVVQSVIIY